MVRGRLAAPHVPSLLEFSLDELALDRLAFKRVPEAGFGLHERGDSALGSRIPLSICKEFAQPRVPQRPINVSLSYAARGVALLGETLGDICARQVRSDRQATLA